MSSFLNQFWQELFKRKRGTIKPGCERTQFLITKLFEVNLLWSKWPKTIVVGGTNGKGSTCAFLSSILQEHGLKTLQYTSPHLIHVSERFLIQGQPIPEAELLRMAQLCYEKSVTVLQDVTFFEILTLVNAQLILEHSFDVFVCEVGLGGTLDSTNAFPSDVSIVTSIGLDHMEYLGIDLESIAQQKAGIGKRNKPLLAGPMESQSMKGLEFIADKRGCIVEYVKPNSSVGYENPLVKYFPVSAGLAVRACEMILRSLGRNLQELNLRNGLESAFMPARFQKVNYKGNSIYLDSCHNTPAARFVKQAWELNHSDSQLDSLVLGPLSDKQWESMIEILGPLSKEVCLCAFSSDRSVSLSELTEYKKNLQLPIIILNNVAELSSRLSSQTGQRIAIMGSISFVGEVMLQLGVEPYVQN